MDLTFKQRLFVEHYLGDAKGNGTKAAQMAGYGAPNVAAVAASRLLRNAKIAALVENRVTGAAMSANEVLARLSEHASGDLTDFGTVNADGSFSLDLRRAKRTGRTRLLKKLKVTTKTTTVSRVKGQSTTEVETKVEVELHNPQFALDKLGQYHGLYAAKENGGQPGEHPIAAALRKAAESLEERSD